MGLSVHDPFVDPFGNPLGLARGAGSMRINPTIVDFVDGAAGEFKLPAWCSFFRVTVVGAGASSGSVTQRAGAGAGLSRSGIINSKLVSSISYSAAPTTLAAALANAGASSSASFGNITLLATGGGPQNVSATPGIGGMGFGGVDNFKGGGSGTGNVAGGGGAAGTRGNGGNGASANGSFSPGFPGTNDGGGGGACYNDNTGAGGGGVAGRGGSAMIADPGIQGGSTQRIWGEDGGLSFYVSSSSRNSGAGGGWGGGAGCNGITGAQGGYGGVRIELW